MIQYNQEYIQQSLLDLKKKYQSYTSKEYDNGSFVLYFFQSHFHLLSLNQYLFEDVVLIRFHDKEVR